MVHVMNKHPQASGFNVRCIFGVGVPLFDFSTLLSHGRLPSSGGPDVCGL
jgi:hypothetical protein